MWAEKAENILKHPITGYIIALISIAIAFSGKLSMRASNVLLFIALILGGFGIFRSGLRIRSGIILCLLFAGCLGLISWWIKPTSIEPKPVVVLSQISGEPTKQPTGAQQGNLSEGTERPPQSTEPSNPKKPQPKGPSNQQDSVDITEFNSKSQIVFYNPGVHKLFVSHLLLGSEKLGYSRVISINETVEGKSVRAHHFETQTDLGRFHTRKFSEDYWQKFVLKWNLKENECIRWVFFISNDPVYQMIKAAHGSGFQTVPLNGTLYFRSLYNGHQSSQDVNIFAVPWTDIRPEACRIMLEVPVKLE